MERCQANETGFTNVRRWVCWRKANKGNLWTQLACWRRRILTSKELSLKAAYVCKTYLWDWGRQRRSELILWSPGDWGLVKLLSEWLCGVIIHCDKLLTQQHVWSAFTCVCEEQREAHEYKINPLAQSAKVLISQGLLSHVAACLEGRRVSIYWCPRLWDTSNVSYMLHQTWQGS